MIYLALQPAAVALQSVRPGLLAPSMIAKPNRLAPASRSWLNTYVVDPQHPRMPWSMRSPPANFDLAASPWRRWSRKISGQRAQAVRGRRGDAKGDDTSGCRRYYANIGYW